MIDSDFKHLLYLVRALRLAEKGNVAWGVKPNPDDAARLRTALDFLIAEHDHRAAEEREP
jgi:hypothetical protein